MIVRWQLESKPITWKTWNHVQMNVKHFLSCCDAISKKEIDALTLHPADSQCGRHSLSDAKYLGALFFSKVGQVNGMPIRNYQQVAGCYRLNIHERRAEVILVERANFDLTSDQLAYDTFIRHWRLV